MDRALKEIFSQTIKFTVYRFDFDNGYSYIEKKKNSRIDDCFFVEKEYLWPNGSVKPDGIKYFYSEDDEDPEKTTKPINCLTFDEFDKLYYIDDEGRIQKG